MVILENGRVLSANLERQRVALKCCREGKRCVGGVAWAVDGEWAGVHLALLPARPLLVQICPAQAITIETEEREDGSRRTTRWAWGAAGAGWQPGRP